MEINKLHDYKYLVHDSDRIFSIEVSPDKKFYKCSCPEFLKHRVCEHLAQLRIDSGDKAIKVKKFRQKDHYAWMHWYEDQFIKKLGLE